MDRSGLHVQRAFQLQSQLAVLALLLLQQGFVCHGIVHKEEALSIQGAAYLAESHIELLFGGLELLSLPLLCEGQVVGALHQSRQARLKKRVC